MRSRSPLDPKREKRVLSLFEEVLDLSTEARDGFLDQACLGDVELRARVDELLSVHGETSSELASVIDAPHRSPGGGDSLSGDSGSNPLAALLRARPEIAEALHVEECSDVDRNVEAPKLSDDEERYRVGDEIARGGMGIVYRMNDSLLRRSLAMKVSRDEPNSESSAGERVRARILEEAQVTGQLDHPGVVPLHDVGYDATGRAYFTMRLVEGLDLGDVFKLARDEREGWSSTRVLNVLVRVCETLAFAHSKGVIHRDLKPSNIMVGRYGEAYVMDWGLAKVIGREDAHDLRITTDRDDEGSALFTMDGTIVGTPAFMSPEQAGVSPEQAGVSPEQAGVSPEQAGVESGDSVGASKDADVELDERSDIYAVGAMLYNLLSSVVPYGTETGSTAPRITLAALSKGPPIPLVDLAKGAAPELIAICDKAMARNPEARYASMDALAEDLRAYLENRVVRAHRTGAIVELRKWVERNRGTAVSLCAVLLLLIAGLVTSLFLLDEAERERDLKEEALGLVEEESAAKGRALIEKGRALDEKEQALRRAEATRLSAQSSAIVDSNPGLALMTAISGHRLDPSFASRSSLIAALSDLREEHSLIGHEWVVNDVAYHPKLNRIASVSADWTVRVWDLDSGEELYTLGGYQAILTGVRFDASGDRLATWGEDASVRVWDGKTGRLLRTLRMRGAGRCADFSPSGEFLVGTSWDSVGRVWRLGAAATDEPVLLIGHEPDSDLRSGRFSFDGKRIVTGSTDHTARIWNANDGELLHVLRGHSASVVNAEFSSNGSWVLTASEDGTARLWRAETGELLQVLSGHDLPLSVGKFSPDSRWVLTASEDGTARLYEANTGRQVQVYRGHDAAVMDAAFSPDSKRVVSVSKDREAQVWWVATGETLSVLRGHRAAVTTLAISPDGLRLATGSRDATARIWNIDTREKEARFQRPKWDSRAVFDVDRQRVLELGGGPVAHVSDANTGSRLSTLTGHDSAVLVGAFSSDGSLTATGSEDGSARVWETLSGQELHTVREEFGGVHAVSFSPDGRFLATAAGRRGSVWRLSDGARVYKSGNHRWTVNSVAFSPDSKTLASIIQDGVAFLVDLESSESRSLVHSSGWLHLAKFSSDGRRLLTASSLNRLYVWDVDRGRLMTEIVGHDSDITQAALDSSQRRLATAHADGSLFVWGLPVGRPSMKIREVGSRVVALGFDETESSVWAEGSDGLRRSWPLDPFAVSLRSKPRRHTRLDNEAIGFGSRKERRQQELDWRHLVLSRAIASAEHSLREDPSHFANLSWHANRVEYAAYLLPINAETRSEGLSPVRELMTRGIRMLERVALSPRIETIARARFRNVLSHCDPLAPTYRSIDLALRRIDRQVLLSASSSWRIHRGLTAPSPEEEWRSNDFDDGVWSPTSLPVGYGYSHVANRLDDMSGSYSTVYLRGDFQIEDPAALNRVELEVHHDDGFAAWINDKEIVRVAAGTTGLEAASFEAVSSRPAKDRPEFTTVYVPRSALIAGRNVIAIQGLNRSLEDPDFYLKASVRGFRQQNSKEDVGIAALEAQNDALPRRYLSARLLQRRGEWDSAASIFRELASEDLKDLCVAARLVECLRASGKDDEAESLLLEVLSRSGKLREYRFREYTKKQLRDGAWRSLRMRGRSLEEYILAALWLKQTEGLLTPMSDLLPIAYYRLGLFGKSILGLEAIRGMRRLKGELSNPRAIAFLTLARHRIGEVEQAREMFELLLDPDTTARWSSSPYILETAEILGLPLRPTREN